MAEVDNSDMVLRVIIESNADQKLPRIKDGVKGVGSAAKDSKDSMAAAGSQVERLTSALEKMASRNSLTWTAMKQAVMTFTDVLVRHESVSKLVESGFKLLADRMSQSQGLVGKLGKTWLQSMNEVKSGSESANGAVFQTDSLLKKIAMDAYTAAGEAKGIGKALGTAFGSIRNVISSAGSSIANAFKGITSGAKNMSSSILTSLVGMAGGVTGVLKTIASGVGSALAVPLKGALSVVGGVVKETASSIGVELGGSLTKIGGTVAIVAASVFVLVKALTMAVSAIVDFAMKSIPAFNQLESSMKGLESTAKFTGISFGELKQAAQEASSDGLMSMSESSTALKNLLRTGFGLKEANDLLKGFKDSAAFGRQGALSFGQAVVSATEGVKNQNSILVDNAGVTKNISVILKEYGFTMQDLSDKTKGAAARQALYTGLMKEMAVSAGDASKMVNTLQGAQSRYQAQMLQLHATVGGMLAPAMKQFYLILGNIAQATNDWLKENADAVQGVADGLLTIVQYAERAGRALIAIYKAYSFLGGNFSGLSEAKDQIDKIGDSFKDAGDKAQEASQKAKQAMNEARDAAAVDAVDIAKEYNNAALSIGENWTNLFAGTFGTALYDILEKAKNKVEDFFADVSAKFIEFGDYFGESTENPGQPKGGLRRTGEGKISKQINQSFAGDLALAKSLEGANSILSAEAAMQQKIREGMMTTQQKREELLVHRVQKEAEAIQITNWLNENGDKAQFAAYAEEQRKKLEELNKSIDTQREQEAGLTVDIQKEYQSRSFAWQQKIAPLTAMFKTATGESSDFARVLAQVKAAGGDTAEVIHAYAGEIIAAGQQELKLHGHIDAANSDMYMQAMVWDLGKTKVTNFLPQLDLLGDTAEDAQLALHDMNTTWASNISFMDQVRTSWTKSEAALFDMNSVLAIHQIEINQANEAWEQYRIGLEMVSQQVSQVTSLMSVALGSVSEGAASVVSAFGAQFQKAIEDGGEISDAVLGGMIMGAQALGDAIGGTAGAVVSAMGRIGQAFAQGGWIAGVIQAITEAVTALFKAFQHNWGKDVSKALNQFGGIKISEDLTKKITDLAKKMKDAGAAIVASLGAIAQETGITAENFSFFTNSLMYGFEAMKAGKISADELAKSLAAVFPQLADLAVQFGGSFVNQLNEVIKKMGETGVGIDTLTSYMEELKKKIQEIKNAALEDLITQVQGLGDAFADFMEKMKGKGMEAGGDEDTWQKFLSGDDVNKIKNHFNELQRYFTQMVAQMRAQGMSMQEIFQKIGPLWEQLAEAAKRFGFDTSKEFERINGAMENFKKFSAGFAHLDFISKIAQDMNRLGALTHQTFLSLENSIANLAKKMGIEFKKMSDGTIQAFAKSGSSGKAAIQSLLPYLIQVIGLHNMTGMAISKNDQALIDLAKKYGMLPSDTSKVGLDPTVTALNNMLTVLQQIQAALEKFISTLTGINGTQFDIGFNTTGNVTLGTHSTHTGVDKGKHGMAGTFDDLQGFYTVPTTPYFATLKAGEVIGGTDVSGKTGNKTVNITINGAGISDPYVLAGIIKKTVQQQLDDDEIRIGH